MLPGVYQAKKKTTPYIFEVRLPTAESISALAALTRKKGTRNLPLRRQTARRKGNNADFI